MRSEILNQKIVDALAGGPMSKAALAMELSEGAGVIQRALNDLIADCKVCSSINGYEYELAHGGYYTGPGGDAA